MSNDSIVAKAVALAAAALLACAPMVYADEPGAQDDPAQQDDQQQDDPGNPAESIPGQVPDGLDQPSREIPQNQSPGHTPGGQGLMYLVNGVPTCLRNGAQLPPDSTATVMIPPQYC